MKFKKRILSEEIGLPKSNKKTFTKNKKQKMVVSESQLQRLLRRINEQDWATEKEDYKNIDLTELQHKRYADFKSSDYWEKLGEYLTSQTVWADIDDNTKEGAENIGWNEELWNGSGLDEDIHELEGEPIYGLWLAGFIYEQDPDNEFVYSVLDSPGDASFEGLDRDWGDDSVNDPKALPEDTDPGDPTSPKRPKCCKCRGQKPYSIKPGKSCPKSCPEVPCNTTPPTQGNQVDEGRRLKTTNPITESEIKDMKKWFNRVNRAGNKYNPSII